MSTSDKVVAAAIVSILIYTIMAFIVQFATGTEISPTLTEAWFRFWAVELAVLAGIKVAKTGFNYNSEESEDIAG